MNDDQTRSRPRRDPSYGDALAPLIALVVLIAGALFLFGQEATDGPLQVALILAGMVATMIGVKNGYRWKDVNDVGRRGVASVASAIFTLLAVGALIGTWNMAGTIPTLLFYGMKLVHSDWFYLASALICAVITLGIGSSWTTAGTIGVGLCGLATLAGVSPQITAGAVISGTYFGSKLSSLSPSAVLVAELTGNDVYTHLRAQAGTSIPAFALAAILFAIAGLIDGTDGASGEIIASELSALDAIFDVTPLALLPLGVLVALSVLRVPAPMTIMSAALFAGIMAPVLQPDSVLRFADAPELGWAAYVKAIWQALGTGYAADTGVAQVDALLSRGGMDSMLTTIWLVLGALTFGSLIEEFGLLSKLVTPVLRRAHTQGQLVATAAGTAFALNLIAGDRYVSLIIPARLFLDDFQARGVPTTKLSHAIADAGTLTSPLVPWNSSGAYMAAALGIPTFAYLPFCFFNIISPLLMLALSFRRSADRIPLVSGEPERVAAGRDGT